MTTASTLGLRARGPLAALDAATRRAIVDRSSTGDATVRSRTTAIIARVREEGDAALVAFARDFDRVELPAIEVPRATWNAALAALALFEHWMLMLPLPVEKLWKWSLPTRRDAAKSRNSISPRFDYTTLKNPLSP